MHVASLGHVQHASQWPTPASTVAELVIPLLQGAPRKQSPENVAHGFAQQEKQASKGWDNEPHCCQVTMCHTAVRSQWATPLLSGHNVPHCHQITMCHTAIRSQCCQVTLLPGNNASRPYCILHGAGRVTRNTVLSLISNPKLAKACPGHSQDTLLKETGHAPSQCIYIPGNCVPTLCLGPPRISKVLAAYHFSVIYLWRAMDCPVIRKSRRLQHW
jgi:hypothetical protein